VVYLTNYLTDRNFIPKT